jgi:hypothetical protein
MEKAGPAFVGIGFLLAKDKTTLGFLLLVLNRRIASVTPPGMIG